MDQKETRRLSKLMSLVLRHRPGLIGIQLDEAGWVSVDELLNGLNQKTAITREQLELVVQENDKQRFQFSDAGDRIRATQGHSVSVDLGYEESVPPTVLFHGTPTQFVASIKREGLKKRKRHHVHLHEDRNLAATVGMRRGTAVVLQIDAARMHHDKFSFFVTPNGVWLTDHVPAKYIQFPSTARD